MTLPYYQIDDNMYAVIWFSLDKDSEYDKVATIFLCTRDDVLDTIYPR